MSRFDVKELKDNDQQGIHTTWHSCANPLELIEKGIELHKKEGGKVGYKKPEKEDMFVPYEKMIISPCLDSKHVFNRYLDGIRLTFTPPSEKEESEWEELRKRVKVNSDFTETSRKTVEVLMDKIDELDKRLRKE